MNDAKTDVSFFKSIFETSVEGILVVDDIGNIIMANSASDHIFGYGKGELKGKNVEELVPEKFWKAHKIHRQNYNEQPKKCVVGEHSDLWGVKKDGTAFPMDISLNPNNFDDKPVIVAYLRDTTKRKRDILLLEKSNIVLTEINRKYGTLISNLQGIVFRCQNDRDWTMEYISEGCEQVTGYSPQEFLESKTRYGKIIIPDDRDWLWNNIQIAIAEKRPFDLVYRIRDKKGNIKYMRETGGGVFDRNGDVEALEGFIADITELKNTEEELRGNEAKNRALLEALPDTMIIQDFDGNYLDLYTPEPEKLLIPKKEIIGKNMKDILSPEVLSTYKQVFKKVRETKKPQLLEYTFDGEKGSKMFEGRTVPLNAHALLTIIRDVTDRKKEELLKDSIRRILEQIANKEPLITIATTIVEMVEVHLKGCTASILLHDIDRGTLHKLSAPNLPEGFNKGIEGIRIGENVGSCGTAAFLKKEVVVADIATDLRWKHYKELALEHGLQSCWSFPIFSSDKEVLGVFGIYFDHGREPQNNERKMVADITDLTSVAMEQNRINNELKERTEQLEQYAQHLEEKVEERTKEVRVTVQKLVEANMRLKDQILETEIAAGRVLESQAMFSAISKNFPKGVIMVFNTDFEIVYIDGGELYRMGFDKTQFEGLCIDDLTFLSTKRIAQIKEYIKKTMQGKNLSFEIKFRNKSYTMNTSPLLVGNDQVKWTLFVYNDITEQKEAEAKIRRALIKEQELNELKSRFISMASHEFRTPLSAISTSAILIAKQNMPGKEEKREKYVKQIESNVRNLVGILNDFLSLGKLKEGKVQSKPEQFDLVEFTDNLIHEIKSTRKRNQKIELLAQEKTVWAYLDSRLLQHVVNNLLSNAIKYSEEGDLITVKLKTENGKISIQVMDQGIGIPKKEQANLFDRFFRAENSANIEGTGLGLHIVKQYTELMGGTVSFQSEVGKGTTFLVEFEAR